MVSVSAPEVSEKYKCFSKHHNVVFNHIGEHSSVILVVYSLSLVEWFCRHARQCGCAGSLRVVHGADTVLRIIIKEKLKKRIKEIIKQN